MNRIIDIRRQEAWKKMNKLYYTNRTGGVEEGEKERVEDVWNRGVIR
jgi:hypothetical protein